MQTSRRRAVALGSVLAIVLVTVLLVSSPRLAAAEVAWDQERASELARQLADAVKDLRGSAIRAPSAVTPAQQRTQQQARDQLRRLQNVTRSLANALESGKGKDDTIGSFRRIRTIRNDLAMFVRRSDVREPVLGKLIAARDVLNELAPFYGEPINQSMTDEDE